MTKLLSCVMVLTSVFLPKLQADCTKGNCFDGYGTFIYPSGAKYIGEFKEGRVEGKGILYFSNGNEYIGNWKNNYRQGKGRFLFIEGHQYLGQFKKNKFEGEGTMWYANGDRYEGFWHNNRPNGFGIYFFKAGDHYEGYFRSGKFEGKGTMFYNDGTKFSGTWKDSKKNGTGRLFLLSGEVIRGEWAFGNHLEDAENTPPPEVSSTRETAPIPEDMASSLRNCNLVFCADGVGTFMYSDGSRYIGDFKDGHPQGQAAVFYTNGDRYEGAWEGHAPHGEGILYFANGRVLGANWVHGKAISQLPPSDPPFSKNLVSVDHNNAVKVWALVVGIARYNHMPSLRYTDDDAYLFYSFLKSPEGGALPDEQIKLLIDEEASRENILDGMRQVLLKADENDVVLFYYSGHGLEGAFVPVDFDGFNNRLQFDEIKHIMAESKAKHKLLLGDACYSGGLLAFENDDGLAAKSSVEESLQKYYTAIENSEGGMALMMSSNSEEVSLEDGNLRSGIFSYFLIQGLKGKADIDGDKIITIKELFNYVNKKVRAYTADAQKPTLTGTFDEKMPVGVLRE